MAGGDVRRHAARSPGPAVTVQCKIRRIGGDISYAHVCFYDYGSAQETERSVRDRLLRGWRSDQPGYEIYDVIVRELSLAEIRKECPECW